MSILMSTTQSFRLLYVAVFKRAYIWIGAIICGIPAYVYPLLPTNAQVFTMNLLLYLIPLFLLIVIIACGFEFHKLRVTEIKKLYNYSPEVKSEHVFKVLYDLIKDGQSEKDATVERCQIWDERVIATLKEYFKISCLNNYLMATCRIIDPPKYFPMRDENYNKALEYLDKLLNDPHFRTYLRT